MTDAPLTLAEFEREVEREVFGKFPSRFPPIFVVWVLSRARPFLLRLLAGERERVAARLRRRMAGDPSEADYLIRAMGDPT